MRTFKVYQINFSEDEATKINMIGWAKAEKNFGKVAAHLAASVNGTHKPEHFEHYKHVADIRARDLEDAFYISNCRPESDQITRHLPMHSLSVGDILEDAESGERFFCASFGWDEVTV